MSELSKDAMDAGGLGAAEFAGSQEVVVKPKREYKTHGKEIGRLIKKRKRHVVKDSAGRPTHTPTQHDRNQVVMCCEMGMTLEQIADFMEISIPTLRKHYPRELEYRAAEMKMRVMTNMYNIACDPSHKQSVTAGMFILRTQAGWNDVKRHEISGSVDTSLTAKQVVDVGSLTFEQRQNLRDLMLSIKNQSQQVIENVVGSSRVLEADEVDDSEPEEEIEDGEGE